MSERWAPAIQHLNLLLPPVSRCHSVSMSDDADVMVTIVFHAEDFTLTLPWATSPSTHHETQVLAATEWFKEQYGFDPSEHATDINVWGDANDPAMEPVEALERVTEYLGDERSDWEDTEDDEERANHIWTAVEALNSDRVVMALETLDG